MEITKAIIAGVFTVLSAAVTLFIKNYWDQRKYKNVDSSIRDSVQGKWKGKYEQMIGDQLKAIELQMELKVSSSGAITGSATITPIDETYVISISGGFYSLRFLKMDYENSDKAILQFGAFVFKLSDRADQLTGHFVGYGHISGTVIGGSAILRKG